MRKMNASLKAADGLVAELRLSDDIRRKVAQQCPLLPNGGRSGDNRGIRYVVQNDTNKFTSRSLLQQIHQEVSAQLQQHGITVKSMMSHEEWVLAPTNGRSQNGQKHRDTTCTQPGYLTVLLFFGDITQRGYGGVKIWRNSQHFLPKYDAILSANDSDEFQNATRKLRGLDRENGRIANLNVCNCVVFDSRLIHESLAHAQHTERASLTFYLRLEGLRCLPSADTSSYMDPKDFGIINLEEYI